MREEKIPPEIEELSKQLYLSLSESEEVMAALEKINTKHLLHPDERLRIVMFLKGESKFLHGPFVEICKNVSVRAQKEGAEEKKDELCDIVFMEW